MISHKIGATPLKTITLSAIRMDAAPAATSARLERAEKLVAQAAARGAELAVLPEVFNTGYEYHDANYALAEPLDGETVSWMKLAARKHNLYLAGGFLLRDAGDIYNCMALVSPSGQLWRYEKTYPWAWERAYFRPGRTGPVVAETELGKFGLMICWDSGHARLWARYAGKVDAMLVSSCPPLVHHLEYHLPDGPVVSNEHLGPVIEQIYNNSGMIFGEFFRRQVSWLGVPAVNTTGGGVFRSKLPRPRLSLAILLAARPDLWKYLLRAADVTVMCGYFDETFVADAQGRVLAHTSLDGDDLTLAQVALADQAPAPRLPQPPIQLSPLTFLADAASNALLVNYYDARKNPR